MYLNRALLLVLIIAVCTGVVMPAAQRSRTLIPIDEASQRPDFFSFRANLQGAIAKRDAAALLDAVHADIKNGFGGDDGIEAFKTHWRIQDPDSPLWAELGYVLALGGSFMNGEFVAPYVFSIWPDEFDAFDYVAVTASNVRVRAEPRGDAPQIAAVSFSILKTGAGQGPEGWTAVELEGGRQGFIASRFVRSPVDYRAAFANSGGRWQLRFFVAGD